MIVVREAQLEDAARIVEMSCKVSLHEGLPPPNLDEAKLVNVIFGPERLLKCFVAQRGDELVGHLAFTRSYDIQEGKTTFWIADLYVEVAHRNEGVARSLFAAVCRKAVEDEAGLLQWKTAPMNEESKHFYDAIGAKRDGGLSMFLASEQICELALSGG